MNLPQDELRNLVELRHRSPHGILGMHPLADGSGVVVRAFVPSATKIEVRAVNGESDPALVLQQVHKAGVFEGISNAATQVFAYELVITDGQGKEHVTRDLNAVRDEICRRFPGVRVELYFTELEAQRASFTALAEPALHGWGQTGLAPI